MIASTMLRSERSALHRPAGGRCHTGFTLIELVTTVAIVAILASAALPYAQLSVQRAKEHDLRDGLRRIRAALDAYKLAVEEGRIRARADQSGYPPTLVHLVEGVEDVSSPERHKIYFLRRLPRDPFAPADVPAAESWGLRSYASPPDAPAPGLDVFDVYSLAEGRGLNGVPYSAW